MSSSHRRARWFSTSDAKGKPLGRTQVDAGRQHGLGRSGDGEKGDQG